MYIPKADGKQRPLAVAALEDKIVQRAAVTVLNCIYEEDFLGFSAACPGQVGSPTRAGGFSYGFRPGRGPHDALDALATAIETRNVNWILDADIQSFFDRVSHDWLTRFVEHRIGDTRMLRLIQKWLKVGVLEDGVVTPGELGTGPHAEGHVFDMTIGDLTAARQRLSRRADQQRGAVGIPLQRDRLVATHASAAQSEGWLHVGTDHPAGRPLAAKTPDPTSMAERPFCRQAPEVGAVCLNRARTELCGGRRVTGVPTVIGYAWNGAIRPSGLLHPTPP